MNAPDWNKFHWYFLNRRPGEIQQVKGLVIAEHKWQVVNRKITNLERQIESLEHSERYWMTLREPSRFHVLDAITSLIVKKAQAVAGLEGISTRLRYENIQRAQYMQTKGHNMFWLRHIILPRGSYWRKDELPGYRPPPRINQFNYRRYLGYVRPMGVNVLPRGPTFAARYRNQRIWADQIRMQPPCRPPPRRFPNAPFPGVPRPVPPPPPPPAPEPAVVAAPVQPEQPPVPMEDVERPPAPIVQPTVPYAPYPPMNPHPYAPPRTDDPMGGWINPNRPPGEFTRVDDPNDPDDDDMVYEA